MIDDIAARFSSTKVIRQLTPMARPHRVQSPVTETRRAELGPEPIVRQLDRHGTLFHVCTASGVTTDRRDNACRRVRT